VLDATLDRCDAALEASASARLSAAAAARGAARSPALQTVAPQPARNARAPVRYVAALARPQDAFTERVDNSPTPFALPPPFGHAGTRSHLLACACACAH
jgi:hypothetical protein